MKTANKVKKAPFHPLHCFACPITALVSVCVSSWEDSDLITSPSSATSIRTPTASAHGCAAGLIRRLRSSFLRPEKKTKKQNTNHNLQQIQVDRSEISLWHSAPCLTLIGDDSSPIKESLQKTAEGPSAASRGCCCSAERRRPAGATEAWSVPVNTQLSWLSIETQVNERRGRDYVGHYV